MKCSICEDELFWCGECDLFFEAGEDIICSDTVDSHYHCDCFTSSVGKVIE